jgi:hypothetical protein
MRSTSQRRANKHNNVQEMKGVGSKTKSLNSASQIATILANCKPNVILPRREILMNGRLSHCIYKYRAKIDLNDHCGASR